MLHLRLPRASKLLGIVALLLVLALAGCGGGGSGSTGGPGKGINLIVGSKNDPDGQLLAQMYTLLLQKQGYNVTLKLALGQSPVLVAAVKSGAVDIYPDFNGNAVFFGLPASSDPHVTYSEINNYFQSHENATWLTPAYNLNDSYGICTSQAVASKYHLTSLTDLAAVSNQLTLAGQQDFAPILPPVAKAYGLSFKNTVSTSEPLGFTAVANGQADVNECYTTDPAIVVNHFVLLTDPQGAWGIYNPSPVVHTSTLQKSSAIATTLNPLAAKLTTAAQTALIKQYAVDHTPLAVVAKTWLQQQGLL